MAQKKSGPTKNLPLQIEHGKLPPQALDLEEAVLRAIMLEKDAIVEVIDILKPESFYKEEHQKIYQAVMNLFAADKAIDILTVPEELRKLEYLDDVGGIAYITQCVDFIDIR